MKTSSKYYQHYTANFMQIVYSTNHNYLIGVVCKILALSCFCLFSLRMEALKITGAQVTDLNAIEQFALICFVGTFVLLPFALLCKHSLKTAQIKLYPVRALFSIAGMVTWIEALQHFGPNEAILVNYLTPIIAIIIASLFKYEKLSFFCMCAGIICYIIIFFSLKTKIETANYGFIMAVISSFCWAVYEVICKRQSAKEHFIIQVFFTFFFATIMLLPFSIENINTITIYDFTQLLIITILRITNVILLFLSIKFAGLNWLSPVSYMKLPIMAILGLSFFNKQLVVEHWITATLLTVINIAIILIKKNKLESQKDFKKV